MANTLGASSFETSVIALGVQTFFGFGAVISNFASQAGNACGVSPLDVLAELPDPSLQPATASARMDGTRWIGLIMITLPLANGCRWIACFRTSQATRSETRAME